MTGWSVSLAAAALMQAAIAAAPEPPSEKLPENVPKKAKPAATTSIGELVVTAPSQTPELKLNFDLRGDFGPGPDQPYLRQRPVNGCKPMAGGATHPLNKSGVASGIVCAKRF